MGGDIFRTCPDRPWGPPSLLYNAYRVFPGGKERPGRDADPSPLSSAVAKKESYTSTPPMGRTACTEPQCQYKGALYLLLMCTLKGNLSTSHALTKYFFPLIRCVHISVHTTTVRQFQSVISLLSLQNLLERRSRAAYCTCKLPERYLYKKLGARRIVATPDVQNQDHRATLCDKQIQMYESSSGTKQKDLNARFQVPAAK